MSRKAWKLVSLMASVCMIAAALLAGCQTASPTAAPTAAQTTATTAAQTAAPTATPAPTPVPTPTPVTLKIIAPLGATTPTGIHDNPVANALRDKTGITIDWGNKDVISDWFGYVGTLLASGDLPDACTIQFTDDKLRGDIFAAGDALPLDDLIAKDGPNIQKNGATMMNLLKAFKSNNGDGKLYFLGVQGGSKNDTYSYASPYGAWFVRWDVYKKIGMPVIKTDDDLLNMMKQMQDAYPQTEDGKKTYAMSGFFAETNQFGSWYPEDNIDASMGWMWENSGPAFFNNNKTNYFMPIYDDNGPYHRALKLWNRAQQMGLVDPECYTMKLTQYTDKCTAGRILVPQANWAGADAFNANENKAGVADVGYCPLPYYPYVVGNNAGQNLAYAYYPGGWQGYWVSAKSKNADRVIQLFDYTFSEDGMFLLVNGIQGQHWDVVNGVKTRNDDVIKSMQSDPDYSKKSGVGLYTNLTPFTTTTMLSDGTVLDLGAALDVVKKNLTPLQQTYSKDMNIDYPAQPWLNDLKTNGSADATYYNYITFADNQDLVDTQGKVNHVMDVYAPQLVACKSDAAFDLKWAEFKKAMDDAGYQKLFDAAKAALDKARSVYAPETGFTGN